jgi:hypothetical protein
MSTSIRPSQRDLIYLARTIFAQQYPYRPKVIFNPWRDELTVLMEHGVVQLVSVFQYVLTEDWEALVYPKVERNAMMDSLKPLFRTRDEKIVAPTGELLLELESLERQGVVHVRLVDKKWDVFELSPT